MNRKNRLLDAFDAAPDHFKQRMAYTIDNMEELTMKRRHHLTVLAVALILVLMAGIALAAASFGILDFLSYDDGTGNKVVNENLIPHVQSIGQTFDGDAARLTLHDAICDGSTLSLAWTLENKLPNEDVYVIWQATVNHGENSFGGGTATAFDFFLGKSEVREGGLSLTLEPAVMGDTAQVDIRFSVLGARREIREYPGLSSDMTAEEEAAYKKQQADDNASGRIVVEMDSVELPYDLYQGSETKDEALVRLGYMERLDTFELPLQLGITGGMTDILPLVQDTTHELDGYRMTLARAECSTTVIRYAVVYTFPTEEAMNAFLKTHRAMAIWEPDNSLARWFDGASTGDPVKAKQADGTWTVQYDSEISGNRVMPKSVTIVAHNVLTGDRHPGEAFTLILPD